MFSLTLRKIREQRPDLQSAYDEDGNALRSGVPKTIESWWDKYGKIEYPDLVNRDIGAENAVVQQFVDKVGRYPTEPQEFDLLARIAYDEPPADLLTGRDLPQLELQKLGAFQQAYGPTGAVAGAQAAGRTAQSRLDVLQDALKTKTGAYGAGIGRSKVFEKAGLGGYASLSQSLQARRQEIGNSYERFRRSIDDMATVIGVENQALVDEANRAIARYGEFKEEYNNQLERFQALEDEEREYTRSLQLYKDKMAIDYEYWQMKQKEVGEKKVPWSLDAWSLGIAGKTIEEANALLSSETPPQSWVERIAEDRDIIERMRVGKSKEVIQEEWDKMRERLQEQITTRGMSEKEIDLENYINDLMVKNPGMSVVGLFNAATEKAKGSFLDVRKILKRKELEVNKEEVIKYAQELHKQGKGKAEIVDILEEMGFPEDWVKEAKKKRKD